MLIFVDTAKLSEIREAVGWGIIDGVTTNPTLLRAAIEEEGSRSLDAHVREICRLAGRGRPVSLEVMSNDSKSMTEEAKILYKKFNPVAKNVVIKIPVNPSMGEGGECGGLETIAALRRAGIRTNATLVMTPEQALLAAKAGATYVSPFAGRVDDFIRANLGIPFGKYDYFDFSLVSEVARGKLSKYLGEWNGEISGAYGDGEIKKLLDPGGNEGVRSGVELVRKIVQIFRTYHIKTKIIASSLRHPRQVREVAEAGADVATVPISVIRKMLEHPKTKEGVRKFWEDAVKAKYEELFKLKL